MDIPVCSVTTLIRRGKLGTAPISREPDIFFCQYSFLLGLILNPSDNLVNQSVLVVISVIDITGDTSLLIGKKIGLNGVFHDTRSNFI